MRKRGFTLAEVLITLSIVGVIAALTVPAVSRKFEKQQYISQYKETISIISQAVKMAIANDGTLPQTGTALTEAIRPYLKINTDCTGIDPYGKCLANYDDYKRLDGLGAATHLSYGYNGFILSNGTSMQTADVFTYLGDVCLYINVDLNGKKGPNMYGKDYQVLFINTRTGEVKPRGWNRAEESIQGDCPSDLKTGCGMYCGSSCGVRIMRGDYATNY